MNFKKAICQIWGHDFVLNSKSFYQLDDENKATCTRCGKPKYMTFSSVENNSRATTSIAYQNYNYMNKRQEYRRNSTTLN